MKPCPSCVLISDHIRQRKAITELAGTIFDAAAQAWPHGTMTLTELRIVNKIFVADFNGYPLTISELSHRLRQPRSTVSKHVRRYIRLDVVREYIDPDDRRKRLLRPSPEFSGVFHHWISLIHSALS